MIAVATDYLDAIAHLPAGGTLTFQHVPWRQYEALLEDVGERYHVRVYYDRGCVEVMKPPLLHAWHQAFISQLMHVLTDELGGDLTALGSSTFKYEGWLQALEPDACFYVQNAARVIGIKRFDPSMPPPPPDIAVEIDITSESLNRFHTYARLGVPEIWRYDQRQVEIYHLTETGYVQAAASRAFPFLTAAVLLQFLERSQTEGQSATLRAFRAWVKQNK